MQELIGEMGLLIGKIKNGTATLGEIEAFAAAASQLQERAVVLRYKAYESKVFGTPATSETPEVSAAAETETAPAPEIPAEEPVAEQEETQGFDLFGEPEGEAFDLFSLDPAEEPEIGELQEQQPETDLVGDTQTIPVSETPYTEEPLSAPLETETESPEASDQIEQAYQEPAQPAESADPPQTETPIEQPMSAGVHPVYSRLSAEDNSLASRLMSVRLDSLKGAFGFNERLQIIQELFDGSSEQFAQAIDMLDTLGSKSEARSVVSTYAHRYDWDKDSNLALEFVQKVERRYA